MPVTRATSANKQHKRTQQTNKRTNNNNNGETSSKNLDTTETTSLKKQKTTSALNEETDTITMQNTVINQVSENVSPPLVQNLQTFENTETDKPADMDVDTTSVPSDQQTPSSPKLTTNDSMHAKDNVENMFKDTGFDYNLSPIVKGKDNKSWVDDMENDESREQENKGATYNIITAPTRFYATDNASDIKGNSIAENRTIINSLFICYNGYQGSNYISKIRKFFVYFRTMNELLHAIKDTQDTQHNLIFTVVDPAQKQIKQDAEKGRTLKISDIPLFVKSDVLRNYFAKYGTITRFSMIICGLWQIAFIVFEKAETIKPFYDDHWSIQFLENALRVEPTDLDPMQISLRQQFELKLTGLPLNTNQLQLQDFLAHIKAKSCYIPRDQQYRLRPYAFINFASLDDMDAAAAQSQQFKGRPLFWMEPSTKHCRSCGAPGHEFKECINRKPSNPYRPLYDRFKPEPYRLPRNNTSNRFINNTSYAEALKNNRPKQNDNRSSPANPNIVDM